LKAALSVSRQPTGFKRWFQWPDHPARSPGAVRGDLVGGPRHAQPITKNRIGPAQVDMNLAWHIVRLRRAHTYGLMPAILTRDRVRVHAVSQILMHTDCRP